MTLNIISDLHCGYSYKNNEVQWNGYTISNSRKKDCIYFLHNFLNKFNSKEHNIDSVDKFLSNINIIKSSIENDFQDYDENYIDKLYNEMLNYAESHNIELYNMRLNYYLMEVSSNFKPERLKPADYLIVAGDLGLDESYQKVYEDLKKRTEGKFKNIFYIKGNHDYWWFPNKGTNNVKPDKINHDHRYIEEHIDDYVILGCTLWAPVRSRNMFNVYRCMNDYRYIPEVSTNDMYTSTQVVNRLYAEESKWLREKVQENKDKKIIIVTHDLPRKELVEGKFSKSEVNDAYCVMDGSCDDIKPLVWIHGHSHSYCDITIDGVRYIRNPIGYRSHYGYVPSEVIPDHWYDTVIEI